jgi:hypothetical protein
MAPELFIVAERENCQTQRKKNETGTGLTSAY